MNIWFLCFVIAAVYCCIHVCSVTGEISQRKRRRRAKTTELKQLFSNNYLNSPGGFKVQPWISPFYTPRRPPVHVIAFYVQRARLIRNYGSSSYAGMTWGYMAAVLTLLLC